MPALTANWDDLSLTTALAPVQSQRMTADLEQIAIALVALTEIGKEEMLQAASDLQLTSILVNWLEDWFSGRTGVARQLDVKELRALVLVICKLSKQYQHLVRRDINYWEQTIAHRQLPLQSPALADYLSNFINIYEQQYGDRAKMSLDELTESALKRLIELLFYSNERGHRRLWSALLQKSQVSTL